MPTIEISQEQAAALARGENVSIRAVQPVFRRFISVNMTSGNVVDIVTGSDGHYAKAMRTLVPGSDTHPDGGTRFYQDGRSPFWIKPSLVMNVRRYQITAHRRVTEIPVRGDEAGIVRGVN